MAGQQSGAPGTGSGFMTGGSNAFAKNTEERREVKQQEQQEQQQQRRRPAQQQARSPHGGGRGLPAPRTELALLQAASRPPMRTDSTPGPTLASGSTGPGGWAIYRPRKTARGRNGIVQQAERGAAAGPIMPEWSVEYLEIPRRHRARRAVPRLGGGVTMSARYPGSQAMYHQYPGQPPAGGSASARRHGGAAADRGGGGGATESESTLRQHLPSLHSELNMDAVSPRTRRRRPNGWLPAGAVEPAFRPLLYPLISINNRARN
eukprot:SAG22_NODE_68_length_22846_cov_32.458258_14_plen_263_part_00